MTDLETNMAVAGDAVSTKDYWWPEIQSAGAVDNQIRDDEFSHKRLYVTPLDTQPAGKSRILVVEDYAELAALAKTVLEMGGYEVFVAHTGREAFEILDRESVDLVLLDIDLPDTTGFEIARRLRRSQSHPDVPILFWTGRDGQDYRLQAEQLGASGCLAKPVSIARLLSQVQAILKLRA